MPISRLCDQREARDAAALAQCGSDPYSIGTGVSDLGRNMVERVDDW